MSWIETIRVNRSRGIDENAVMQVLQRMEAELASLKTLGWEICRNPLVKEDIMFVLRWDEDTPPSLGSALALTLVRELRRCGLVDHTVWTIDSRGETAEVPDPAHSTFVPHFRNRT